MYLPQKLGLILLATLLFTSCDGGVSSSGSGIGGTGITLVQGNVSSVNGQLFATIQSDDSQQTVVHLTEWIIPLSYAQSTSAGTLIVSGGGQSSRVSSSGEFALASVIPSTNFVLTFKVSGDSPIPLGIGKVLKGAIVTVKNIAIDTRNNSAKPTGIEVKESVESEDDISEDIGGNSEDETGPEEEDSNENDEDEEEPKDNEDSIDDVSNDDEK